MDTAKTFDDLFAEQGASGNRGNYVFDESFDKEAWAAQKKETRDHVYGMVDKAVEGFTLDNGENFQQYLDVQSHFNRYSSTNALLISQQRPDATRISDFDGWKDQNVSIRKGEKGFYILEPGDNYTREDGSTAPSFNPKKVWDISQTTARRQPQPRLPDTRTKLKALMATSLVPMNKNENLPEGQNVVYQPEQRRIDVRPGLEGTVLFQGLAKEIAHSYMDTGSGNYERSDHAFDAQCVSYMLCKQYGVDTGSFDFKVAPDFFRGFEDGKEARAMLENMKQDASEINKKMGRELDKIQEAQRTDAEAR